MNKIILILLLIFGFLPLSGQDHFKFSHLTFDDGLPDNFSECVLEDSEGFIWIGTNNGLCRYDGSEIIVYQNNPEDSTSISSNYIFELFEDSEGELWIGTNMGGLARFNKRKKRFVNYFFTAEESYWYKRNRINEIIEHDGYLWLASMHGLGRFNPITGKSEWFIPNEKREGLNAGQVMSLLTDEKGNLWVGTIHGGLFYFEVDSLQFTKQYYHSSNPNSLSNDNVKSLYRNSKGQLFIATEEGGINILNEQTGKFNHLRFSANDEHSLSSDDVVAFFEDSKGRFWVGTINGGLNLYDSQNNRFTRFLPQINIEEGINSGSVLDIIEDSYGNIWISTHAGGVNCINNKKNRVAHFNSSNLPELKSNAISAFCELGNEVYIGTDGGGLYKFNPGNQKIEEIAGSGLASLAILDIIQAGDKRLWIATWGGGVSLYDTNKDKEIRTYHKGSNNKSLSIDDVKALYLDGDSLWISGHGGGVNVLHIPSGKVKNYLNNADDNFEMMRPEWGNDIVKDSANNFWFASTFGLHLLSEGKLKTYLNDKFDETSLSGYVVSALLIDSKGKLWIGTENGLNCYIANADKFNRIEALDGKIKAIAEDSYGILWITMNDGLYAYNHTTKDLRKFDESDGLQGKQFVERSSLLLSDGSLLFGGMNGFNLFNPDSLVRHNFNVPTYFTKFLISDVPQLPGEEGSILDIDINYLSEVTLTHEQHVFAFEFSSINFTESRRNEYYYLLEGFDTDWRKADMSRRASYTNLDPGVYVFKVKTCLKADNCDSPIKEIAIIIKAPWWKTIWFRILLLVAVILFIVLVYRIRIRQIKLQNVYLEQKVAERTTQLQEALTDLKNKGDEILSQNEYLTMAQEELVEKNEELLVLSNTKTKFINIIAHDLKSPLNSIIGFSELAKLRFDELEKEKVLEFITIINDSSNHLYELVNRLLEWARSQSNQIKILPVYFSIEKLIRESEQLVKSMIDRKNISLKLKLSSDFEVYADYTMSDTILRNLLNNAIKFTPENGKILVQVSKKKSHAIIEVTDSGIGMPEELKNNLFDAGATSTRKGTNDEKGTGLGLLICQEFVNKNGGKIEVESAVDKGTTIKFTLPLHEPDNKTKAVDL